MQIGASLIQNNSDEATSGLSSSVITAALGGLLGGGNSGGGLDLGSIIGGLASSGGAGGLTDIVGSWMGGGDNAAIEPDQVSDLLGSDKISAFADQLGISVESAKQALADALPEVVNQATPEGDSNMLGDLLSKVGGAEGAMGMIGKMFG
jgi:uncharacterized protein YidB (DUF937 family)